MPKTPDEIKKGLACCAASIYQCADDCPYRDECRNGQGGKVMNEDALALIQRLEAERDAAVEDMKQAAIYLCCACKNYHPAVCGVSHHYCEVLGKRDDFTGAISCGMFKWRGVQKEESPC